MFGSFSQLGFLKKKLIVLYSGVTDFESITGSNIREELDLKKTDLVVLMASTIYPLKGQYDLLKAFSVIYKSNKNIHLLFAGRTFQGQVKSENYFTMMKDYVINNGLTANIHFLGWRDDIPDLHLNSDIYISSSYSETMPDSVRDAMKYSKPVVATNVGGTSELIEDKVTGFLIKPGDIKSIIKYLLILTEDKSLRLKMGKMGKRVISDKLSTKKYVLNFQRMIYDCF